MTLSYSETSIMQNSKVTTVVTFSFNGAWTQTLLPGVRYFREVVTFEGGSLLSDTKICL